jgi:hypothetical protein
VTANPIDFVPDWGPVRKKRQVLTCIHGTEAVGWVTVGLGALDGEPPSLLIDYIRSCDRAEYRSGVVSNWLIDTVLGQWAGRVLRGGPLGDDDDPGPAFRLRTWDRGIEFHDAGCEHVGRAPEPPRSSCQCLRRLVEEVERRQRQRNGG